MFGGIMAIAGLLFALVYARAVRQRKISLQQKAEAHKTQNGAHVGDLFMSPIYTCQLCQANPFDYLTQLQQHPEDLSLHPAEWMPWNYRDTCARIGADPQ